MTVSISSPASATTRKNRQRYLAALMAPTEDPIGWIAKKPLPDFDFEKIWSAASSGSLTQPLCLSTLDAASNLEGLNLESKSAELNKIVTAAGDTQLSVLNEQLILVELPITLHHLSACAEDSEQAAHSAVELMGQRVQEVLDDDAWPGPEVANDFGPLAASWTRCVALLTDMGWALEEEAEETLHWLPRQIMRLKRSNGSLMLSSSPAKVSDELIKLMIEVLGDDDDRIIFERTIKRPEKPRPKLTLLTKSLNSISTWGGSLLFHDSWQRKACKLAASFNRDGCHLEIATAKTLIGGSVFPELIVNGYPLTADGDPDVLVEYMEDRVAFAEIEWRFENDIVMQRQIILSLEDKFAWIGDAVLLPSEAEAAEIEYRCDWKLKDGITTVAETETTEAYLYDGKKMRGLVIPPALSEWKAGQSVGKLEMGQDGFSLAASRKGKSLYMPVFLDLSAKRCLKPRTWRQLSVAENLKVVDADVAVAYRVQVGKKQFAFYRSIAEPKNRTFFGENVNTEMFLGRLEKDGTMTELVQIE